ncbi:MAG: peptidylprolyl isomerase [Granulosicoccus sp.]
MKKLLAKLLILATLAITIPAFAAEDENILVIEVAGANTGIIEIELLPELAPNHVARIKELATSSAYDDVVFHRVIEGFMAQTGDVEFGTRELFGKGRAGMGGSPLPDLKQEFSDEPHVEGIVSMARSQNPDSANSQFFIVFDDATFLDNQYTVFGRVISGMDVVHKIKKGTGQNGAVSDPDYMKSVTIKSDS